MKDEDIVAAIGKEKFVHPSYAQCEMNLHKELIGAAIRIGLPLMGDLFTPAKSLEVRTYIPAIEYRLSGILISVEKSIVVGSNYTGEYSVCTESGHVVFVEKRLEYCGYVNSSVDSFLAFDALFMEAESGGYKDLGWLVDRLTEIDPLAISNDGIMWRDCLIEVRDGV
ncbi:MAG: SUKH-4 family immunity protein [Planctomycetaceae bacterium]|nr:SUKH-4 family immunity protein [Planctomycetaceae bacterium]